ncbi:acetyl-CoA C-acetyltransferase [Cytobacillus firmus]|uniref:acetyl-CoA C-acetyltransferase n=2 Tax=Cytobacillus TaxID=2675230 RepID=A0A366K322_CYTFI|nr:MULTISPECIES: thiolase family protein [Cytobacillus]RBP96159.1 acetyl-CoA C-acetyltransferase [Cytobacillus firmus]TDX45072.1 acetyl-CoA C-acetyltransferase [Cytobacillus oceanisediminis]
MQGIYILDGARTPFTEFGGSFKDITDIDLAVHAAKEAIKRSQVSEEDIKDVTFGNVIHTNRSSSYLARHIGLKSGIPQSTPALTVNRLCGSGMQAIVSSASTILHGDAEVALAGGTENMSQSPHVLRHTRWGSPGGAPPVDDMLWGTLTDSYIGYGMGVTAENLAERYSTSREEQDRFAVESHRKAAKAAESGRFAKEIVPVTVKQKKKEVVVDLDEHIRPDTNVEKMSGLKTAFKKDGTVTAGNASGINDGAAAVVLASESYVKKHSKKPLARIVSWGIAGVDPETMGIGPVPAMQIALKKAGLGWNDIGLIEINEAFAAQSLAVIKELKLDQEVVNVNGGAVALGHPVGTSGARISYSLAVEMNERDVKYGLASLCIGGGQGIALLLEKP